MSLKNLKALGVKTMGVTVNAPRKPTVKVPEIVRLDPTEVRPCIMIQGGSGTGKTHAIARLLETGRNGLVVLAASKWHELAATRPPAVLLGAPLVKGGPPPTNDEQYERLYAFLDELKAGKYREWNGKPLDFIAFDEALEIGRIIYRYWKARKPISTSGEKNTYALWDNVAEKATDFFMSVRDAAGAVSELYGFPPVGILVTVGEEAESQKLGSQFFKPLFPGRKASREMPHAFSQVVRLSCRNNDGEYEFIAHTIGSEEFYAKCPPKLFKAEEVNPDFAEMYDKIEGYYKQKAEGA